MIITFAGFNDHILDDYGIENESEDADDDKDGLNMLMMILADVTMSAMKKKNKYRTSTTVRAMSYNTVSLFTC